MRVSLLRDDKERKRLLAIEMTQAIYNNDLKFIKDNYIFIDKFYPSLIYNAIVYSVEGSNYTIYDYLINKQYLEVREIIITRHTYLFLYTIDVRFLDHLVESDHFINVKPKILRIISDPAYIKSNFKNYCYMLSVIDRYK